LTIRLDAESQVVKSLSLSDVAEPFSFVSSAGKVGIGDASLAVRPVQAKPKGDIVPWSYWRTTHESVRVSTTPSSPAFAEADLTSSLTPTGPKLVSGDTRNYSVTPLVDLSRSWELSEGGGPNGSLVLRFRVRNPGSEAVELGSFGVPMSFPWRPGTAEGDDASVFVDPTITGQHGWVSVTPLLGKGPVLMITTGEATGGAGRTSLEAWRTANELPEQSGTAGTGELLCHSLAYAEDQWRPAGAEEPWLTPSSVKLEPGSYTEFAFVFAIAPSVRRKNEALQAASTAVLEGIPGYVIGADMSDVLLLVKPPPAQTLAKAVSLSPLSLAVGELVAGGNSSWMRLGLNPKVPGRVAIVLTYSDNSTQIVNYLVLPPFDQHLSTYGEFQSTTAYLSTPDAFQRSPSVMPWDRLEKKHVLDDGRNYVVGLSDEAGAAANMGLAAKQRFRPRQEELLKLDAYIQQTLWGAEPDGAGVPVSLQDRSTYGIKSSMFWAVPKSTNGTGMPNYNYTVEDTHGYVWDRARADSLGRAYNYPHQTVVYWSMYHALSENDKLQASQPASWYLDMAANTVLGMWQQARWYSQQGLMAGSVFKALLEDLEANQHPHAEAIREIMWHRTLQGVAYYGSAVCHPGGGSGSACQCYNCTRDSGNTTTDCQFDINPRATIVYQCLSWAKNPHPFGSEFAWDSTGQEEEYIWGRHFGAIEGGDHGKPEEQVAADNLANLTLSAILAFIPSAPHWAYNGAVWSWGDTGNNAKPGNWSRNGRVAGHYRTTLNAIPVMHEWLLNPDDWYLLGPAVGAASLHMATIDADGAASMGFHLDPEFLQLDPYSGDFGVGFFGHVQLASSYFVVHPVHGPLCFFCDLTSTGADHYSIVPRDSVRRKVFIEPVGVSIEVVSGSLETVVFRPSAVGEELVVELRDDGSATKFRIKVLTPSVHRAGHSLGVRIVTEGSVMSRGFFELPLNVSTVKFAMGKERAQKETLRDSARTTTTSTPAADRSVGIACGNSSLTYPQPDHGHIQMQLLGSSELPGFEGGFPANTSVECSHACASQISPDGWHRLACNAWTWAEPDSADFGVGWCWLWAGRGNAIGTCGFVSATCDNRPSPPADWPCCVGGFGCPNPSSTQNVLV